MARWTTASTRRIWCFDVENRPGPYGGGDFTFKEMLSLAGCYTSDPKSMTYCAPGFTADELEEFVTPLREGSMAVTHNGFRHDLPLLNGTLIKYGLKPLDTLLVSDTYAHLIKRGAAFSASLGNLAARFDVGHQKGSMGEYLWERAYAGDIEALGKLRTYNCGDVRTTIALRKRLLQLNLLRSPSRWSP
jgi:hypothetical protein